MHAAMDSSSDDEDIIIIDDSSDDEGNSFVQVEAADAAASHSSFQNDDDNLIADEMDLTLQSSAARQPQHEDDNVINVDHGKSIQSLASSSSSSSSSGLPGPSPYKKPSADQCHRPPSVIHTTKTLEASDNDDDDLDRIIDEFDAVPMPPTASSSKRADKNTASKQTEEEVTKSKAKKLASKHSKTTNRKRTTAKSKASSSASINSRSVNTATSNTTTSSNNDSNDEDSTATKHYHCYLLRSLHPDHPLKTYIGFTTNPSRRIRQHNGILKAGGANKTKRAGRPWTFVAVIHGFQDKITALQFEWAWQNVDKSIAFREAVGCDALARKMKRRLGPKARLDELRWLLKDVQPFCLYSLTVYFPEREYCEIFRGIVSRGKSGNPYKKDDDESECRSEMLDSLLDVRVSAVEDMPFAQEIVALRERKKALRQRKKEERQAAKKKKKDEDAPAEYGSDISSWLETYNDDLDDDASCSDLLDESDHDGQEVHRRDLSAIEEDDNSSVISSVLDNVRKDTVSSPKPGMDDLSSTLQSLSIGGVSKKKIDDAKKYEYDDCDFSTISSADSDSSDCFMKHGAVNESHKENQANKVTATTGKSCDFFDLCSP